MVDDKIIESIFGWIGLTISSYFYLSPVVPFIKVLKGEMKYLDSPGILLIISMINCILWTDYGLLVDSLQLYLTCAIGGTTTFIWITIYFTFVGKKQFCLGLFINILFLALMIGIMYFFYIINIEITGYCGLIINILMFASPGEKIITVIKTGKYELIPIFSSIGSFLCGGSWFIFGLYKEDWKLIIPNGLGMICGALQLVIYFIYYCKRKSQKPKEEDPII